MSTSGREAVEDYSKENRGDRRPAGTPRTPVGPLVMAAAGVGLAGVALAVVATFSTVIKIVVLTVTPATFTGMDRYGPALLLLGGFGLLMILGGLRGARPAMAALALAGIGVLLVAVIVDVPHIHDKGVWPLADQYEDAEASAGTGFYFETAAGVLMLLGGALMLLLAPRGERAERAASPRPAPATREERRAERERQRGGGGSGSADAGAASADAPPREVNVGQTTAERGVTDVHRPREPERPVQERPAPEPPEPERPVQERPAPDWFAETARPAAPSPPLSPPRSEEPPPPKRRSGGLVGRLRGRNR